MKDTIKFNVVKATYEDGDVAIATAINNAELEKIDQERLMRILDLQRVTLLEKGDEDSKDEAYKIMAIQTAYQDAEIVFEVAKQPITRDEYIELYHAENVNELLDQFEGEVI